MYMNTNEKWVLLEKWRILIIAKEILTIQDENGTEDWLEIFISSIKDVKWYDIWSTAKNLYQDYLYYLETASPEKDPSFLEYLEWEWFN